MQKIEVVSTLPDCSDGFPPQSAISNKELVTYEDLRDHLEDQVFIFQRILVDLAWALRDKESLVEKVIVTGGDKDYPYPLTINLLVEGNLVPAQHEHERTSKISSNWLEGLSIEHLAAVAETAGVIHGVLPVFDWEEIVADKDRIDRLFVDWMVEKSGRTYIRLSALVEGRELWIKTSIEGSFVSVTDEVTEVPLYILKIEETDDSCKIVSTEGEIEILSNSP